VPIENQLISTNCGVRPVRSMRVNLTMKSGRAATRMAYCGANATILVSRRGRGVTLRKQD
jgi:hypothetical protein